MKKKKTSMILVGFVLILFLGSSVNISIRNTSEKQGELYREVSDENESTGLQNSSWPKFRGNNQNTGLSPYNTSHIDGVEKWSFDTGRGISSAPAVGKNGTIYTVSDGLLSGLLPEDQDTVVEGYLHAINPNGAEKWRFEIGEGRLPSSPALSDDGTIYIGSSDGNLYAVNQNGSERWRFETGNSTRFDPGGPVRSSPAIGEDGTIYVGSDDNNLYAINPNGSEKWSFETEDDIRSSPALSDDGTINIGSSDGNLYAVNQNGSERWRFESGGSIRSSPAVGSDGTIYVGSTDNNLYAIYPNGTEKWRFFAEKSVLSSPAISTEGTIYIATNQLYAIDQNGTEKWNFSTGAMIFSSPSIGGDGTIFFGSQDGNIYAVESDGTEKWSFETFASVWGSPAINEDGSIYIGSKDGNLYAIGEEDQSFNRAHLIILTLSGIVLGTTFIAMAWKKQPMVFSKLIGWRERYFSLNNKNEEKTKREVTLLKKLKDD